MTLIFSTLKGLHEIDKVADLRLLMGEEQETWLERLGYECCVQVAGRKTATTYTVYSRESTTFKYVLMLESAYVVESIFCHTTADMIACRAFLSPIVLAESMYVGETTSTR